MLLDGFGIVCQVRMGSTRLPGKVMLPFFDDESILDVVIKKLLKLGLLSKTIIATTNNSADDKICDAAAKYGCLVFRGEEHNVLKRFIDTAKQFSLDKIIRICSDNPFLDSNRLLQLVKIGTTTTSHYVAFNVSGKPSIQTHFGFWAEYVTLAALEKVQTTAPVGSNYHEHVTNYIYTHPEEFKIKWIQEKPLLDGIRLTIDTPDDFEISKTLYHKLSSMYDTFGIEEVVKLLDTMPDVVNKMRLQINANKK
ncbi:MAG: glycosyl transferase family 2 [Fibrobacteres bacterium]|nr:glycosyl transferase family 2 [Fibrobacterota bacterium]